MKQAISFLKKNYGNVILVILLIILAIPQIRMPVQVFVQRIFSFSPKETAAGKRKRVSDYNWQLQSTSGEQVNFNRSKGRVTIINFWATWCPPCVAEMPSFQHLFEEYRGKVDFYFIGSEQVAGILSFLSKKSLTIPVYLEQSPTPSLFETTAIPATFVISKKGEIYIHTTGAADWNSHKVKGLLDKLMAEE